MDRTYAEQKSTKMKLAVNIKSNNNENNEKRVPCPADIHQAVCVDVQDMGWIKAKFGWKGYVKLFFETEVDDKYYLVKTYRQNAVISGGSKKSNLYKMLAGWIGEGFAKKKDFDLSQLVGKCATIIVEQASFTNDGGEAIEYAYVDTIKAGKIDVEPSGEWTPLTERDDYEAPEFSAFSEGPPEAIAEREAKREAGKAKRDAVKAISAKEETDEVPF